MAIDPQLAAQFGVDPNAFRYGIGNDGRMTILPVAQAPNGGLPLSYTQGGGSAGERGGGNGGGFGGGGAAGAPGRVGQPAQSATDALAQATGKGGFLNGILGKGMSGRGMSGKGGGGMSDPGSGFTDAQLYGGGYGPEGAASVGNFVDTGPAWDFGSLGAGAGADAGSIFGEAGTSMLGGSAADIAPSFAEGLFAARGGVVPYVNGGKVKGKGPLTDHVKIKAMPGEYVLDRQTTQDIGPQRLAMLQTLINAAHGQTPGTVNGRPPSTPPAPTSPQGLLSRGGMVPRPGQGYASGGYLGGYADGGVIGNPSVIDGLSNDASTGDVSTLGTDIFGGSQLSGNGDRGGLLSRFFTNLSGGDSSALYPGMDPDQKAALLRQQRAASAAALARAPHQVGESAPTLAEALANSQVAGQKGYGTGATNSVNYQNTQQEVAQKEMANRLLQAQYAAIARKHPEWIGGAGQTTPPSSGIPLGPTTGAPSGSPAGAASLSTPSSNVGGNVPGAIDKQGRTFVPGYGWLDSEDLGMVQLINPGLKDIIPRYTMNPAQASTIPLNAANTGKSVAETNKINTDLTRPEVKDIPGVGTVVSVGNKTFTYNAQSGQLEPIQLPAAKPTLAGATPPAPSAAAPAPAQAAPAQATPAPKPTLGTAPPASAPILAPGQEAPGLAGSAPKVNQFGQRMPPIAPSGNPEIDKANATQAQMIGDVAAHSQETNVRLAQLKSTLANQKLPADEKIMAIAHTIYTMNPTLAKQITGYGPEEMNSLQAAKSLIGQMFFSELKPMLQGTGQVRVSELNKIEEMLPSIEQTPEARDKIVDWLTMWNNRSQHEAIDFTSALNRGGFRGGGPNDYASVGDFRNKWRMSHDIAGNAYTAIDPGNPASTAKYGTIPPNAAYIFKQPDGNWVLKSRGAQ